MNPAPYAEADVLLRAPNDAQRLVWLMLETANYHGACAEEDIVEALLREVDA